MKNTYKSMIATAALLGSIASLNAVTYNAGVDGLASPAGITFSATGGNLVVGDDQGIKFLGVDAGLIDEVEIGESIVIDLLNASKFSSITIGLLYDGPEFGDVLEKAVLRVNGVTDYILQATGLATATYSNGAATVTNLSVADGANAAVWQIDNPFLGTVSKLELFPMNAANVGVNKSDFGLVEFSVPDFGPTIMLLGLGFLGLAAVRKRMARD